jgi:cytochrome P450
MEFLTGGAAELQKGVDYWKVIISDRRARPQDDFVSVVLASNAERLADGMSDDEMAILMWSLTYAGHDSTALTLGNALGHLAEHPEDRQVLIEDPARLPDAIEEILRFYTPLHQFRRTLTRSTEVRGVAMTEGDPVLLLYASANRDGDVFDEPDSVKLDRSPNPHMSFGGGIHGCPGRFLARTEIRLALHTLLRRYPDFTLLAPVERTGLEGGGRHMGVRRLLVDLQPS